MTTTFVVHVEDRPGVLTRVTEVFRRRSFNLISLTVGPTHEPGVSRMTIAFNADRGAARRLEANLYKLVNVLRVDDITERASVQRDLAIIKVASSAETRSDVMQLVEVFRARVVDVAPASLVIEITGTRDKIDGLVEVLRPYGVLELARTGVVAMTRGLDQVQGKRQAPADPVADDSAIAHSV